MADAAWGEAERRVFGMQLGNDRVPDSLGPRVLVLVNGGPEPVDFALAPAIGGPWAAVFDTGLARGRVEASRAVAAGASVRLEGASLRVLTAASA